MCFDWHSSFLNTSRESQLFWSKNIEFHLEGLRFESRVDRWGNLDFLFRPLFSPSSIFISHLRFQNCYLGLCWFDFWCLIGNCLWASFVLPLLLFSSFCGCLDLSRGVFAVVDSQGYPLGPCSLVGVLN